MIKLKQALSFLAAFICLGAALYIVIDAGLPNPNGNNRRLGANTIAAVGSPAPLFALRNLSHELISLQPSTGTVTILNFWSTTCAPCRREMRDLQRLHNHNPDLIRILAINLGESREAVTAWRDNLNLTFELLLDQSLAVAKRYQIRGQPTTYLLDERQIIKALYFGPLTYGQMLGDIQRLAPQA